GRDDGPRPVGGRPRDAVRRPADGAADAARVARAPPPRALSPARRRRDPDRNAAGTADLLVPARPRRRVAALDARAGRGGRVLDGGVGGRRRGRARVPAHPHKRAALPERPAPRRARLVVAERSRAPLRAGGGGARHGVAASTDPARDLAGGRRPAPRARGLPPAP